MSKLDDSGPQDETAVRFEAPPSSSPSSGSRSRFTPGALLADRFRIIAPLGRGGMGEVYRAEDVKLGQQVALKFLSRELEHDRDRLNRLYGEVRLGRQVSHPNVCRLYDIVEYEGSHFISMEYIDGEDLGSLLRRIGKLPEQKALELTHEICAGLAAAHGVGIVHRDLKPANIMIDGRGRARVTDFGLAEAEEEIARSGEIAGTPAYMAPEQLRGAPATAKTDLYALGLVLYEMFTGKRYGDARESMASAASRDRSTSRSTVSDLTRELDPAIQRVIVRCLEQDPESRPPSIHAVIAALPGGDPLQAALDAGETPSPEMVAAAGATGELPAKYAIPLFILAIVLLLTAIGLHERTRLTSVAETTLRPEALEQRARDLASAVGYPPPRQTMSSFGYNTDFKRNRQSPRATTALEEARSLKPSPLRFNYRENPREMIPLNGQRYGNAEDPPFNVPGMLRFHMDAAGRLVSFVAVPPAQHEGPLPAAEPDFGPLFAATGLDLSSLREIPSNWSAPADTDWKRAWTATFPGQPDLQMRVEAASRFGKPVFFYVIAPWVTPPVPEGREVPALIRWSSYGVAVALMALVFGGALLARRNWRRGRADRAGSAKVAGVLLLTGFIAGMFRSVHSSDPAREVDLVFNSLSNALFVAALAWTFYLAIEPYLRRRWPATLVSWSRLLAGRAGDPMVGRDLLIGVIGGCAASLLFAAATMLMDDPVNPFSAAIGSTRQLFYLVVNGVQGAALHALAIGVLLLLGHLILRHRALALAFAVLVLMVNVNTPGTDPGIEIAYRLLFATAAVGVFVRFGVLPASTLLFTNQLLIAAPLTLDPSSWLFARGLLVIGVILAIAAWGFYRSLGSQPIFAGAVLDD
jgi:hypothetical protein